MAEANASGQQRTRSYHSPLRERQAAETRQLILEALAQVIADEGATDFTVDAVARQAEVATRTVYRHFPDRQALLDGLTAHIDERFAELRAAEELPPFGDDVEPAQLLVTLPEVMARFDELEPFSTAMVLTADRGMLRSAGHEGRTETFQKILAPQLEGLDPAERDAMFAVIRHLLSSQTWFALRKEFGLDGEVVGRAVARSIEAILEQAAPGDG